MAVITTSMSGTSGSILVAGGFYMATSGTTAYTISSESGSYASGSEGTTTSTGGETTWHASASPATGGYTTISTSGSMTSGSEGTTSGSGGETTYSGSDGYSSHSTSGSYTSGSEGTTSGSGGETTYSGSDGYSSHSPSGSYTSGSSGTTTNTGGHIIITGSSPALTIHSGELIASGNTFFGDGDLNATSRTTTVYGDLSASINISASAFYGSVLFPIRTEIAANAYNTCSVEMSDYTILVDTTLRDFAVVLPSASLATQKIYNVKKLTSPYTLTITSNSGAIDGNESHSITTQYQSYTVHCDGIEWHII